MAEAQQPDRTLVMETYREKATRKFKENPWVPIGALATCAALITAMVKMRQGDSRSFNHWLRVRVVAQGLTVAAMVAGTYTLGTKNTDTAKTQMEAERRKRMEAKREQEKSEFELRLKEAEDIDRVEREITGGTKQKEQERLENRGSEQLGSTPVQSNLTGEQRKGWWSWFGRGGSKS